MNASEMFLKQKEQLSQMRANPAAEVLDLPEDDLIRLIAREATRSYSLGISYRNFRVGAAALFSTEEGLGIEYAANFKGSQDCEYNRHAEQEIISALPGLGAVACRVLAVSGDLQVDQHSGQTTTTLHPCGWCRDAISTSPLITDQALLVTVRPDLSLAEYGSRDEYLQFHADGTNNLRTLVVEE